MKYLDNDYYDEELHVDLRDLNETKKISTALNILINKIKFTKDHDECINTASTFYDMAYRKGFEAGKLEGKKEGRVKVKVEKVYVKNENYRYNGECDLGGFHI